MDPALPFSHLPRPAPLCCHPHPGAVFALWNLHPQGPPRDAGSNSSFGNTALNPCFGPSPPKKAAERGRQRAGGAGRVLAASPRALGAAGRKSCPHSLGAAGSTPLQLCEVKTKPWRCSGPSPTQTRALLRKGVGNEGISSPRAELSCRQLLLPVAFDSWAFWGLRSCLQSPSPFARLMCNLNSPAPWFLPRFLFCTRATPHSDLASPKSPELFSALSSRGTEGDSSKPK